MIFAVFVAWLLTRWMNCSFRDLSVTSGGQVVDEDRDTGRCPAHVLRHLLRHVSCRLLSGGHIHRLTAAHSTF